MITPQLLISLLLILVVAWFLGSLFFRFGLPFVLGELMAGVILGPPLLGLVGPSPAIELLAELGIFFVMFHAGMEMNPKVLVENIGPSLIVAAGGFIVPFVLGFFTARIFGGTVLQSLFVGMCISITAIAVQSVILYSMKISRTNIGHIIIGAAIADDIFSLIVLSVLLGLVKTGTINISNVVVVFLKVAAFFGITIFLGYFIIPKFTKNLRDNEAHGFTFAISTALATAFLAELVGLHLIIGAFLAGMLVRREIMDKEIYNAVSDRFYGISYGFLVPIFFASLSFHLHLQWERSFILFGLAITLVAVIGKLVGSGLGLAVFRRNFWESMIVGFGMNGRGAVEIVVASVVIRMSNELMSSNVITTPLLTNEQFSVLILMAFITTMMTPVTLKWSIMKACLPEEKTSFCRLWDEKKRR